MHKSNKIFKNSLYPVTKNIIENGLFYIVLDTNKEFISGILNINQHYENFIYPVEKFDALLNLDIIRYEQKLPYFVIKSYKKIFAVNTVKDPS